MTQRAAEHYDADSPYGGGAQLGIISEFRKEHEFLSNLYESPFEVKGKLVPTAEHAFQAQKTSDPIWRQQILAADGPRHAKYLGRQAPLRPGWEEIKFEVMRQIIAAKFPSAPLPGGGLPELSAKLLATGAYHLVEGNFWGDTTWGCVHPTEKSNLWVGSNWLGILLMERRAQLQREIPY